MRPARLPLAATEAAAATADGTGPGTPDTHEREGWVRDGAVARVCCAATSLPVAMRTMDLLEHHTRVSVVGGGLDEGPEEADEGLRRRGQAFRVALHADEEALRVGRFEGLDEDAARVHGRSR